MSLYTLLKKYLKENCRNILPSPPVIKTYQPLPAVEGAACSLQCHNPHIDFLPGLGWAGQVPCSGVTVAAAARGSN